MTGALLISMVRLNVTLRAASARDAFELLETLRLLMASTRLEPGCLDCAAWAERDSTVHYSESWAAEADVRRRVRSSAFTSLLGVMECASAPPLVRFDFVAQSRGLDYVEEIRGGIGERQ
jgi:quinol monooxygenase YgiN